MSDTPEPLTDAQALALCPKLRREGWRQTADWIEGATARLAAGERQTELVNRLRVALMCASINNAREDSFIGPGRAWSVTSNFQNVITELISEGEQRKPEDIEL